MPEKSNPKRHVDLHHDRFTQIGESHCGPAVIQMLLNDLGIEVNQEEVTEAGGANDLIEQNGMRIDQLAQAVTRLAPQTIFWYKDHSKIEDLITLVVDFDYLVGIEWQGLFEDSLENETQDGDYGHYSVVTMADSITRTLNIADPYKDFRTQDRIFTFEFFQSRWWDINNISDPLTKLEYPVEDRQMMFLITPIDEVFPEELGMKQFLPE